MSDKRIELQLRGSLSNVFHSTIKDLGYDKKISTYTLEEEERSDLLLQDSSGKPIFLIELKDPLAKDGRSVFHYETILKAMKKAQKLKVKYFGLCNFIEANLIDYLQLENDHNWYVGPGNFFTFTMLNRMREKLHITPQVEETLRLIAKWYIDKALEIIDDRLPQPKPVDERFIYKLRSLINGYHNDITDRVWAKYQGNNIFKRRVQKYFEDQQWTRPTILDEIGNFTYIALLLLISKLIFYKALKDYGAYPLPVLNIPKKVEDGEELRKCLWEHYFISLIKITKDFELFIGQEEEVINNAPFIENSIVDFVKNIIQAENTYDFSKISHDIIGKIFEAMIREEERHKLGQYFTPSMVVDLINAFCIRNGKERVLDTSCGSGTFLVRSYVRKQGLTGDPHPVLLDNIYGIDISSYACYLSMFNLAIRNFKYPSYPRIIKKDFFDVGYKGKEKGKDMSGNDIHLTFSEFDAIVGNPPYTRQEEIDSYIESEKDKIVSLIKKEWYIEPSLRSSIYAYFFYHGGRLLRDKGYFGFITSNSWLSVDYGEELQKWMLDNFRIITVIDSKVERFFPSADVNTVITILKKEKDKVLRDTNIVKFVYLKKFLHEAYKKFGNEDNIRNFIENTKEYYEDEYFRIKTVRQEQLYNDNKWSKYLKATKVFWRVMEKGKGKWVPLKEAAEVRFGIKTGANEFFHVKDKTDKFDDSALVAVKNNLKKLKNITDVRRKGLRIVENGLGELWLIEEVFLKPLLKGPREVTHYIMDIKNLKYKLLVVNNNKEELESKYPYVYRYIRWGESKGKDYDQRETCEGRDPWYSLGYWEPVKIIIPCSFREYFRAIYNDKLDIYEDKRLYGVKCKNGDNKETDKKLMLYLASTLFPLSLELLTHDYGGGGGLIDATVQEIEELPFIDFEIPENDLVNRISKKSINSIFEEIGAVVPEEVSLDKVEPNRLELDNLLLREIGFTNNKERNEILLEMYRDIIDIVKSRLEKAKSITNTKKNSKKIETGIYVDELIGIIEEKKVNPERNYKFARNLIKLVADITPYRKLQNKIINNYWYGLFEERFNLKELEGEMQGRLL